MKTIWVVGSLGNVGSAIIRQLNCLEYEIIETDKDEVDITDEEQVRKYMNMSRPDVVINCAGYSDVQKCEENIDEAYKVNALGVRNLAQAAYRRSLYRYLQMMYSVCHLTDLIMNLTASILAIYMVSLSLQVSLWSRSL